MKGVGTPTVYRSRKDIDRHVEEQFNKLNNEHEKKLKGLAFARMYFKVFEYELAKQYVTTFLSVNANSPEGRRLLGHCYDKLGNKEKAVAEYQKSLASSPNQPELLLSCCELMIDPSVKLIIPQAEQICKQTEDLYPYHPTIYQLKERLLTLNGNCDPSKVEKLLNAEISNRPDDMDLRIKQLNLFESSGRLSEAYEYAINIEKTLKFQKDNVAWYEAVSKICEAYESSNSALNWEFYLRVLPIYEHTASLLIIETKSSKQKSVSDCYTVLFRLDQALYKAIQLSSPQTEFYRSLIQHMSNQFYFHLATVIMKSAKKENSISWFKSNQLSAPLFLMSLAPPIDKQAFESFTSKDLSLEQKSNIALWDLEGTRRIIESGFVLRAMMAKEDPNFIENVRLLCITNWKMINYKKIFNGPEYAQGIPTSFFIHYSTDKLIYNIPELIQYALPKHVLSFEISKPGSLHHLVWYGIQLLEGENKESSVRLTKDTVFPVGFGCKHFSELPLVTNSLSSSNIESISQLDMNTFLYATVLSVASFLDNQSQRSDPKAPQTFPSNITDQLTTSEQENWWNSMYKIYSKNVDIKHVSQLRKAATQGLEAVRLIGNHGIDVQLMVYLAKNFTSQANKIMDNFLLKSGLEKRAVLYWGMAIQLLERMSQNGVEHKSKNALFEFYRKSLTKEEVNELLEEGRFYLACQLMNNDQNEEAIEAFSKLHTPYASFYQAMIYKKMIILEADETTSNNTLSESNNLLLTKVKELLNITKERIKNNLQHPLHSKLKEEIFDLKVEAEFNGTSINQSNLDILSGENNGGLENMSGRSLYKRFSDRSFHNTTSTPVKSQHNSNRKIVDDEVDAKVLSELKIAIQSQNVQCQTLGLQYYNMIETLRTMSEKVDKLLDNFNNTKKEIFEKIDTLSHNFPTQNSTSIIKPVDDIKMFERINSLEENLTEKINAMHEIIRARQDDLYDVYQENDGSFDKIAYDPASCIQNTFDNPTQLSSTLGFPSAQLPFSSSLPFQSLGLFNQLTQSNPLPVYSMAPNPNVNITLSDTLPTGPPVPQPPLSVIIPTHHILSNISTSDPQSSCNVKFSNSQIDNQSQPVITCSVSSVPFTTATVSLPISSETFSFKPSLSTFKESFDASLNKSRNSATDDSYTEEHDPIPEFKPIIPLPAKIEEVTGEENDTVLFERWAKLYKYVEKEWKEKGVGILKILKNNDSNKVRLVMRRDQVHKICANHFLYENMELKSKNDKAVLWSANDFSDTVEIQVESLCARFKTAEDCEEFTRIFNENKQPCSQNSSSVNDSNVDICNDSVIEAGISSCLTLTSENVKSLKHELGGFTFSTPPIINEIVPLKEQEKTPEKPKGLFSNLSFSTPAVETGTPVSFTSLFSKSSISEPKIDINSKQSTSSFVSTENTPKSGLSSSGNASKLGLLFSSGNFKSGLFSTDNTPKSGLFSSENTNSGLFSTDNTPKSGLFSSENTKSGLFSTDNTPKSGLFSSENTKSGLFSTDNTPKSGLFSSDNTPKLTENLLFSNNKTEEESAILKPKLDFTSGTSATSYFSTLAKSTPKIGFINSPDFKGFPGAGSTIFNVKTNPSPHAVIKSPVENANDSLNQQNDEAEFVPTAEFTPVIPLPEKVNVVTGEEGLKVVFDDRAKLLKFHPDLKEWKERGIGQMKILFNPDDGYYQLLMRRELVFKVCCNQRLSADLELKPVYSSDKAMSWMGQDFSDGECKKELFAVRFKTVEQLHAFRDKFNEIKEQIQESTKVSSNLEDIQPKLSGLPESNNLPKLNDLAQFKPKPGSWTCDACYLSNDASKVKCVACSTLKPGAVDDQTTENKDATAGFTFGQPSFSSMFKFGGTMANSQPAVPFVMPKFDTSTGISFGSLSSGSSTNTFGTANETTNQNKPLTWREESAGLVKYDSDKSDEGTDETDNDSYEFDEQESVVENNKDQFSSSNVKIEKSSFLNSNLSVAEITSNLKKNQAPETITENAVNLESDSDLDSVKIIGIKPLKDVISHADQGLAEDLKLPLSFFLYKSKPKCKGCVGCENDTKEDGEEDEQEEQDIDEQEITSSKTDNEKEIERAKEEQDEIPVSVLESNDSSVTSTNTFSQFANPTSFLFGDKSTSTFEKSTPNPIFGSKAIFGSLSVDSTKTDDTKSTNIGLSSTITPNPPMFGAFSTPTGKFSTLGSTETSQNTAQSLFSKTDDNKCRTETLFSFSPKTDSPFKFGVMTNKDPKLVFGQSLFSATNKSCSTNIPQVNPWAGKSSLNKSTDEEKHNEKKEENVEENGEEEVDNSHDPHFEPIIPLPDAIEVSTGEENETILFRERSKLFRKDGAEYKERGIGEMKILYHAERNTYRLLFRREKVFKVVCNHLITSDIKMAPMKSSSKAYCWACMNMTEDSPDPQTELLAIRFKTEELADTFKQIFDDCVSKLGK